MALFGAVSLHANAHNQHANETRAIDYMPTEGYANTVGSEYVVPSINTKLKPSQKIKDLAKLNFDGEIIVQKLTDNTFWLQYDFYSVVFYVGEKGVMLLDPLAYGKGKKVLEGIRRVTQLPITTLVYSSSRPDHLEDANVFVEDAKAHGVKLEIIASTESANIIKKNKKIPTPTKLISLDKGSFQFEGVTVSVQGLKSTLAKHDSAIWIIEQEKVAHQPHLLNPDQVPFMTFAGAKSYNSYKMQLAEVQSYDWTFLSSGHGDIGTKADVKFTEQYVLDMEQAVRAAYKEYREKGLVNREFNNHHAKYQAVSVYGKEKAVEILREKYGNVYGFEAAVRSHITGFVHPALR